MPPALPATSPPESFVVRIYRRDPREPGRIAGTVEIVASGIERSFNGARELQSILGKPTRGAGGAAPPQEETR